ncbi:hypothetical protein ABPG75_002200 [Micractinium tetrahymenae]
MAASGAAKSRQGSSLPQNALVSDIGIPKSACSSLSSGASADGGSGAAAAAGSRSLALLDLPDDLLGHILALAGRQEGPAATLACKRFHRCFWGQAALWREVEVAAAASVAALDPASLVAWFQGKQRLLQRVAGMVEDLKVSGGTPPEEEEEEEEEGEHGWDGSSGAPGVAQWASVGWRVPCLLEALAGGPAPAKLRRLQLSVWGLRFSWAEAAALARLTRLEQLALGPPDMLGESGRCYLPPSAAATALRQLSGLRDLALSVEQLPPGLLPAVLSLAHLTRLVLAPLPASVHRVSELSGLQSLQLHELDSHDEGLALPPPDYLQRLEGLQIGSPHIQVSVPGGADMLRACFEPEGESLVWLEMFKCNCCDRRTLYVHDTCMQHSAPLLALLGAGGAAGGHLRHLRLSWCHVWAEAVGGAGTEEALAAGLQGLHYLELQECEAVEHAGMGPFLCRLLPLTKELRELGLSNCQLAPADLPSLLAACPSPCLTRLELVGCQLAGLPDGDYLAELEELSVARNKLTSLPAAVAKATNLGRLCLGGNAELALAPADLDALSALPCLEAVELWGTAVSLEQVVALQARAPNLAILLHRPPSSSSGSQDGSSTQDSASDAFGSEDGFAASSEDGETSGTEDAAENGS